MGRFSAPQFDNDNRDDRDDDDDGQDSMPMDWDVIPEAQEDEHHDGVLNNGVDGLRLHDYGNNNGNNNNGSQSLVCYNNTTSNTNRNDGHVHNHSDDHGNFSMDEGSHHVDESTNFTSRDDHLQDATTTNNNNQALLRVAEQYLEHSNQYLEQQYLAERNRRRTRTITIIGVAVIAIVLKRHAPPPPPLLNQSPLATTSSLSTDDLDSMDMDDAGRLSSEQSMYGSASEMLGGVQHETWASYSQHVLYLMHHALVYGLSVAWYAISNAFCYAYEEIRDGFSISSFKNNKDESSLWRMMASWKEKLISFTGITAWSSHHLQTNEMDQKKSLNDIQHHDEDDTLNDKVSSCPIRIPAASNRHTYLPRGATSNSNSMEGGWSTTTEDCLRQIIGASLSPQNLALKVIAEGMDIWGESLVEDAPVAQVHQMATTASVVSPNERLMDKETLSGWILPPATGNLLVGPEGVGKLHTARRLAQLLLGHCLDHTSISNSGVLSSLGAHDQELEGALEVIAGDYDKTIHDEEVHPIQELIVNHIHARKGLGSVIIIHHIESMPTPIISDIARLLSGKSNTLSYHHQNQTPDEKKLVVEASCDGTVFVMTSKQWGTKSIFQQIQRNEGLLAGLRRESLVSSIRWEVDSHLDIWTKLASHTTVAPFLPFQQEDLSSILQSRVQALNLKYQGLHWKRLEVSLAAMKYFTGVNHVDYLDLYNDRVYEEEDGNSAALLTFSSGGAHALGDNALWQTLRTRLVTGTRRRPGLSMKVGLDENSKEATFSWCKSENNGLESCELEWASILA